MFQQPLVQPQKQEIGHGRNLAQPTPPQIEQNDLGAMERRPRSSGTSDRWRQECPDPEGSAPRRGRRNSRRTRIRDGHTHRRSGPRRMLPPPGPGSGTPTTPDDQHQRQMPQSPPAVDRRSDDQASPGQQIVGKDLEDQDGGGRQGRQKAPRPAASPDGRPENRAGPSQVLIQARKIRMHDHAGDPGELGFNMPKGGILFWRKGGTAARPMPPPRTEASRRTTGHGQAVVTLTHRAQGLGHDMTTAALASTCPTRLKRILAPARNSLMSRSVVVGPSCKRSESETSDQTENSTRPALLWFSATVSGRRIPEHNTPGSPVQPRSTS